MVDSLDKKCISLGCGECPLNMKGICNIRPNENLMVKALMGNLTLKEILNKHITYAQERIKDCMEIITEYKERRIK